MKNDNHPPPSDTASQLGGRIWKMLLGLFLIGIGSIFVQYLWNSYLRAAKMDTWVEVPCRIESIKIDDAGLNQRGMPKYLLQVAYQYEFAGFPYTGTRLKRLSTEVSDPRKLKSKIETYATGSETICHVDPDAPEFAVLQKDSKASLYSIWFPCLFIVGGAGMVFSGIFRKSA